MSPLGFGVGFMIQGVGFPAQPALWKYLLTIIKTNDNWIIIETVSGISPNQGEQGTTLTYVILYGGKYTTFQDNHPVEVNFDPPDGLTVSNIDVTSNDTIIFDLEIAVDAPVGYKNVIVVYDNGKKSVECDEKFLVTEKTN